MLGAARHPSLSPKAVAAPPKAVAAKTTTLTMQRLLRQAAWGCAAAAALFVAVISGRSDNGAQRAAEAFGYAQSSEVPKHQFDAEAAARQLAGAIRGLNEDRDRLTKRLAALERDMDDTTGSIKRQIDAIQTTAATQNPPWPTDAPAVPMIPVQADITAMAKPATPAPASRPATTAAAAPAPAEETPYSPPPYGVDVGNATSMKGLQTRWTSLLTAHPQLFAGLQPLVSLRENPRTNRAELHLVIGPFSNAEAATQICGALVAFRTACQPTMFDGSHLALQ